VVSLWPGPVFVGLVYQAVPVQETVERGRNAHAALGARTAQPGFEQVGVGGVHLQAHGAHGAFTPAFGSGYPPEVKHPHPPHPIAANAVDVQGALCAKVAMAWVVVKNAQGGFKVFVALGQSRGDGRRAQQLPGLRVATPENQQRLHRWVAVYQQHKLALAGAALRHEQCVLQRLGVPCHRIGVWVQPGLNLGGKRFGQWHGWGGRHPLRPEGLPRHQSAQHKAASHA